MKKRGRKRNCKSNPMPWALIVEYRGGYDCDFDRAIEKAVGGLRDGSGFCFFDETRDLSFGFKRGPSAEAAKRRVKAAFGRKVRAHTRSPAQFERLIARFDRACPG
jgi:hypothetical protein